MTEKFWNKNNEKVSGNNEINTKNVDSKLFELVNKAPSFQLEKIETVFSWMSKENVIHCTNLINSECSRDINVMSKWDFMWTLSRIETLTV